MKENKQKVIGGIILLLVLVGVFFILQPSAKDILIKTIEKSETINSAHLVVDMDFTSPEESGSGKIEFWVQHTDESGMFRIEVLESSRDEAIGAIAISNGETVWIYSAKENKVYTGTLEEAKLAMEENQSHKEDYDFNLDEFEHPETAEEAVDMLLEYFDAKKAGTDTIENSRAYKIELKPISDQMPAEYTAVGGIVNLWIDKSESIPVAFSFTESAIGEININTVEFEINQDFDDSIFTFDIPADAEVIQLVDMIPETLSIDEAIASADFDVLVPEVLPDGATLVDIITVQDVIVQRYTFAEGGSFSINQGKSAEIPTPSTEKQSVSVRGFTGSLFVSENTDQVLLTWVESEVFLFVAGDITGDQAISIAESLK